MRPLYTEILYFHKLKNHTWSCSPVVRGANVDPTSQVRSSAMLVIPIVWNWKVRFLVRSQWHNIHVKLYPNPLGGSRVELCGQMDRLRVHFVHIVQNKFWPYAVTYANKLVTFYICNDFNRTDLCRIAKTVFGKFINSIGIHFSKSASFMVDRKTKKVLFSANILIFGRQYMLSFQLTSHIGKSGGPRVANHCRI
jgi:hypothetical protein